MRENGIEVLVSGSDCSLISFTASAGKYHFDHGMSRSEAHANGNVGYPSATVPLGNQDDGSPFGLFLLVRENREDLLFRFMSAFEATMHKIQGPSLSF